MGKQQYNDFSQFSIQELSMLLKQFKKIEDKKGVVVVMEDDHLITTYNYCSYNRKLAFKHIYH